MFVVSLAGSGSDARPLLVTHRDIQVPVCSTDWLAAWNTPVCQQMGYGLMHLFPCMHVVYML